jgi:glycosyltransferase involved in cell wall biosynthesis
VVIESLSAGTPVLISDAVGLANYVAKNNLGWICHTKPESVADAISNIALNQKDKLQQISSTAPAIIHTDFDDDKLVQRYISVYRKIITTK